MRSQQPSFLDKDDKVAHLARLLSRNEVVVNLHDYAVLLAAKGFPVFKLSNSRRPTAKRFWESATIDLTEAREFNAANIGVATGGHLIVIDIDVKNGAPGYESLAVLEAFGLPLDTFTVRTTSASEAGPGLHLYYKVPAGHFPNRARWFPGVDVRGYHGYVVAPGSEKDGKLYEIERDLPLRELPLGFHASLAGRVGAAAAGEVPEWADNAPAVAAAVAYLIGEAPVLGEGERDDGLIKIANRVLDLGISPDKAVELITEHWLDDKCFPPVPFEDIEEKVVNAAKSRHDQIGFSPPRPEAADCFEIELCNGLENVRKAPAATFLARLVRPSALTGEPPSRNWVVPGLIPADAVTLLSGDGGTGKSLLALQLCAAMALRAEWLGRPVIPGRTLYFSAEDDRDELHRRLDRIAAHYGAPLASLDDMLLLDFTSADAILGTRNPAGNIVDTPLHRDFKAFAMDWRPSLIVVDTLADTFGGDEIVRTQARQFVALLRQLCPGAATLLLAHPSLSGMASGAGTSGSTGWHNSVRSRLYFRAEAEGHVLTHKKANYGPLDAEIKLAWRSGAFVPLAAPTIEETAEAEALADSELKGHVARLLARGQILTAAPGPLNAPSVIVRDLGLEGPDAKKARHSFNEAMTRLLDSGVLKLEPYQKADRKQGLRLTIAEA